MKIMIVGGGEVGADLAKRLAEEDQDIVLIDKDKKKVHDLNVKLDIIAVEGNGASIKLLEEAGIKETSMLIAVTHIDEVNIMACMIAKKAGVKTTVARIRNQEYEDGSQVLTNEQLGIDIIINPEKVAAQEIIKIIKTPNVNEIEYFAHGRVLMVGVTATEKFQIIDRQIKDLPLPDSCLIAAVTRLDGEVLLPRGDDIIYAGDKLYIIGKEGLLKDLRKLMGYHEEKTKNIAIFGGGMIGLQIAKILEEDNHNSYKIKLMEKDMEKCNAISGLLKKTMVINGDVTDVNFLKEEVFGADATISVTGDDEGNLLSALIAKDLKVKRPISEVIKSDYYFLFNKMGMEYIISPRLTTVSKILKRIRKGNIVSLTILESEAAEIMELIVSDDALISGKEISQAEIPKGITITTLIRDNEVFIPTGATKLCPGDHVILFLKKGMVQYVDKLFSPKKDLSSFFKKKRLSGSVHGPFS